MRHAGKWLVSVITTAVLVVAAGSGALAAEQYVLKLAHISTDGHPSGRAARLFAQLVNERTGGRVRVDVFPNSTLGSAEEYTEQIQLGTIDMGLATSGQMQAWVRPYAAVMIPFLFDGYDHAHRVLDGEAGRLLASMAEREGFVVLANWEWGFRQITNSRRAINTPADLQGLKIRVPMEMQLQAMFKALNVSTAVIAFPELYLALAQRVVDGQENPLSTIYYQKFFEVQRYLALTNHVYNSQMLIMSQRTWGRLPADVREVMRQAAIEAGQFARALNRQEEGELVRMMEQAGIVVTRPNPAVFRAAVQSATDEIAAYAGRDFTAQFIRLVDEAR